MPRIQHKRGTSANLASVNPTPLAGELVWDSTENAIKIGDGATAWTSLAYVTATPRTHTHSADAITSGTIDYARLPVGSTTSTVCAGDDARLSDARTPTAHKSTHATGGSDALTPADIGAAPAASPTFTGTVTVPGLTSTGVILADDSVAANSVVYSFDGDPNTGIGRGGEDIVTVVTNGSERVRVDSGGNVGVGTSPASFNSAFNNVVIGNGSSAEGMTIYSSAQGTLAFGDTATTGADGYQGYLAYIHSGDYMVMATGGAERLRVSAVGAGFGVGDLSRFSASFRDIVVGSGVGNHGITINSGQADVSTLAFASNVAQFRGAVQYFNETWAGGEYMRLLVGTLPRLAILANGRVGVGTEAPSSLLHVAGVITVSATSGSAGSYAPSLTISGDSNTGFGQVSGQSDTASVFTAGHERVRVNANGNVGIGSGNTSPSAPLHVVGETKLIGPITEGRVVGGNTGTAKTIALTNGTLQDYTLTGNCTFTMPTATAGQSFTLMLRTGLGNYTATFTGVKWPDSTAPVATTAASKLDLFVFVSDGTNWYGSVTQNYPV